MQASSVKFNTTPQALRCLVPEVRDAHYGARSSERIERILTVRQQRVDREKQLLEARQAHAGRVCTTQVVDEEPPRVMRWLGIIAAVGFTQSLKDWGNYIWA